VNGEPVRTQARITLQPGDHVRLDLPGGGGYGAAAAPLGLSAADGQLTGVD
jgi:N-methylhydantoinase B